MKAKSPARRALLIGRAGSGKTHVCLERLTDVLRAHRKALLLVPTYSQAEHLRFLLLERAGGLSARTVETFSSLAERLLKIRLRDLASAATRDRLAERALAEVFPEAAGQAGFRAEFLAAVKEIKEQGLDRSAALDLAYAHFREGTRGRRLFEAFARYGELLTEPDHEDFLVRARNRLREKPLDLDLLLVDGFHDFTAVERQIVDLLAEQSGEALLTLPLDMDEPAHPVFETAARTAASFPGWRREVLRGSRRCEGSLAALERRLFTPPGEPVPADSIEVLACASDEDEADRLARLVVAANRPYRDFLLVRRSFDGLHALYRAAFARYGVPLRFSGPEPLASTPVARAAAVWLRSLAGPLPPEELLLLLRSPYFLPAPPRETTDRLARALREEGGFEYDLPERRGSLPELLRRELGLREAVVGHLDDGPELARAARFLSALESEAEAVSDLPLEEAAERVRRRVPLLRATVRDRRHDCVYAVEAMDARQWEKPVVLVAGLDARSFPHQVRQDLFLRDEERAAFGRERGLHLPLRSRKEEFERYLFYVALTRSRERLVLSWAAFDEQGTARPASPYLEDALEHLAGLKVRRVALREQYAGPGDAVRREDLLPIVADGLARAARGEGALAAALYDREAVPREELAWPRRLDLLRQRPIPVLPRDPAAKLSPSAINDYLRCPYLFLMRRVLRVRPARAQALDPLLKGTIVHEVLQRCAEDARDPGAIFDEVFAEKTEGFGLGLEEEAQRRWMRMVVRRAAEELRASPVAAAEKPFEIPAGDVVLCGRIDRIDRHPCGDLVRDYKTGLARPEDVQLDAYLLAVERPAGAVYELLRKGRAEGFVLPELKDAVAGKVEVISREDLERRREKTRALVARVAAAVRAGRLAVHPREPEKCTRTQCDGFDLCRVARGRWLVKAGRK